eukprot:363561-Chlamydomonas_euryale.AAC.5
MCTERLPSFMRTRTPSFIHTVCLPLCVPCTFLCAWPCFTDVIHLPKCAPVRIPPCAPRASQVHRVCASDVDPGAQLAVQQHEVSTILASTDNCLKALNSSLKLKAARQRNVRLRAATRLAPCGFHFFKLLEGGRGMPAPCTEHTWHGSIHGVAAWLAARSARFRV